MQTHTQFPRTESLQIKINPHIKEKIEYKYSNSGLSLEDIINNYLEEDCKNEGFTEEQCNRLFNHPDMQEAIIEIETKRNNPNTKWYESTEELFADLDKDDK